MRKIVFLSLSLCVGFSLLASSASPRETKEYLDVTTSPMLHDLKELATFQEVEESATTADKGTWHKRYRVWTDFTKSGSLSEIETIINQN